MRNRGERETSQAFNKEGESHRIYGERSQRMSGMRQTDTAERLSPERGAKTRLMGRTFWLTVAWFATSLKG